jgi:hypothetical protein
VDVTVTLKCASFWDALVLRLMLEEQGARVHRPDEGASLSMVVSGPLDGIRAAVAQLQHEFPRSGTVMVVIEKENGDEVAVAVQPEPATGAAAQEEGPASAERADGAHAAGSGPVTAAAEAQEGGDPDQLLGGKVVIVPGEARYHRRRCTLIRLLGNDDLKTLTRPQAEADGCVPCQACKPDRPLGAQI